MKTSKKKKKTRLQKSTKAPRDPQFERETQMADTHLGCWFGLANDRESAS